MVKILLMIVLVFKVDKVFTVKVSTVNPPVNDKPAVKVNNPFIVTAPVNDVNMATEEATPDLAKYSVFACDNVKNPEIEGKKTGL